ncbi:UDP-N-acetylmuramoyl-L-alanine--D-glutamate ligase [Brumicola blandensis]|uniref:UDP-N-acetylmuramoylalanine--D-glutamate ligase n=1 Tax=Brumicola blandensis TaxID=3075611 RepID=A0AAW8R1V1_9ALTE|nr:UDP-N-acetylmuramoyl-L-alanine--D-glutamate ligase [Alteromonas sp. W409]MDT0583256.1 UDP-N-acetylmuramoyl-L-alanine--D-glutamate ligase [Alteromonas sp. W409]
MNPHLAHQSIAVVGYGITGRACVRFLLSKTANVTVIDKREDLANQILADMPDSAGSISILGFRDDMDLSSFDWVILSPGVSPHQICFERYKSKQGRLIGDIELFALFNKTPLIGITGSNGKTTVTDMLGECLRAAGLHIELAGNYGKCALDLLLDYPKENGDTLDFIVLELSSFQLEVCQSLRLEVATILNITEDHIDRHGSFENYKVAKQTIFDMTEAIVVNLGEDTSMPANQKKISASVSLDNPVANFYLDQETGAVLHHSNSEQAAQALFNVNDMKLVGAHNYINAMTVLAICHHLHIDLCNPIEALKTYGGLAHRFELVSQNSKITWINDSKATNVGACLAALKCFENTHDELILVAGGDAKGTDLHPLKEALNNRVNQLIVFGKDAKQFILLCPSAIVVNTLEAAVSIAASHASQSSAEKVTVLLSPACASLDMFANYQQRGDVFRKAVLEQEAQRNVANG